jgi:hypothetical protein
VGEISQGSNRRGQPEKVLKRSAREGIVEIIQRRSWRVQPGNELDRSASEENRDISQGKSIEEIS